MGVGQMIKANAGVSPVGEEPARISEVAGYGLTLILGVYGGFFSGGYRPRRLGHLVRGNDGTRGNRPGMTTRPNIGLQRTSACGLAAAAGPLGGEGRIPGITAQEVLQRCGVS
jgi:hypothetical protein